MKQKFTLFDGEHTPETITIEGEHVSDWNGMPVPRVTGQAVIDYWGACRQADPSGEWYAVPFVDETGALRIPSFNDPDDREEDYVYLPNGEDGEDTFDVDGLVWSLVDKGDQR